MKDLPAPITLGKDPIATFELSLPFARTHVHVMFEKIREAELATDVEDCITIAALREQLTTPSWAPLEDSNSPLCKILLSDAFKNERKGTEAKYIDSNFLRCFALLHC